MAESDFESPAVRIARFRRTCAAGPADIADFLPPSQSPDFLSVLVELIKLDLEIHAKTGRPTRLELYLGRFASDLPAAAVPMALLYEEYRVRHRFADAPPVAEYQARFPARFEEFLRYVADHPLNPPPAGTVKHSERNVNPREGEPSAGPPARTVRATPAPPQPPPSKPVPHVREQYKTIELIGRGMYGRVYLAEAPGGVPVAMKELLRGIDHPTGQSELQSLEVIKRLHHPFLIQVHTFWQDRDQLFIVMDLAEGSLADRIQACKERGLPGVPVEELVPFFAEAAEALDYLHGQNVTHRDIKPQNLLYLKGHAKVADLGLARSHNHKMTTVAQECGTPLYMAPEVWRKKVAPQSDQYSLAATYVAARLDRPLFESEFMDQLIGKHLDAVPDLRPLPVPEQRVLLKALAKRPEDRYPTCKEFVDDLRTAVLPAPVARSGTRRALLACGVSLGCGLAYLAYRLLAPVPGPPPGVTWKPAGWEPTVGSEIVTDHDGRTFYKQVERTVDDVAVVAVLVPAVRDRDPASFYLTRDKVSNRVMAAAWAAAEADPGSDLARFRREAWVDAGVLLPGVWKDGARTLAGKRLGSTGSQLDLPAVGVTAVEAALAVYQIGGTLPSYAQWQKAAGFYGEDPRAGPAGDPPFDYARLALRQHDGPWPLNRETTDVSVHGIRQLFSNGLEWTRDAFDGKKLDREVLLGGGLVNPALRVVGNSWDSNREPTFAGFGVKRHGWNETKEEISFRVVLERP